MTDFDSPWKEALDVFFEPFLHLFFPDAHADIDWSRGVESLDKELQKIAPDAAIGRRFVDKLLKVWLKSGGEQWVLVHIEVQASKDADFGWRMYVYNYRLFDRYNVEVASFAVLADDDPDWRPDGYGYRRWGTEAGLKFPVVKLLDYASRRQELEASSNPFATIVLAHLDTLETRKDPNERKSRKFHLVRRLLDRGWAADQVRRIFKLIDWMMELPEPLGDELWEQITQYETEKHMPYISTQERYWTHFGLCQGIEAMLKSKYGEQGLRLMPEIREIKDSAKLTAVLEAIESAATPEDLRPIWENGAVQG